MSVDISVDIGELSGIWIRSEIQGLLASRVLVMGVVDSSAGKG